MNPGALAKKAKQLRNSGFAGPKGIIACDAGCDALATSSGPIAKAFFQQHQHTVSFVAVLNIPDEVVSEPGRHRTRQQTRTRPRRQASLQIFHNAHHDLSRKAHIDEVMLRMVAQIPPALRASQYARGRSFDADLRYHNSFEGAYMIDGDPRSDSGIRIKVSARAVLQALAGDLRFRERCGHSIPIEFFQHQLKEGRVLKAVQLERSPDDDDDWFVLEFSGPDAAISPYAEPSASERK